MVDYRPETKVYLCEQVPLDDTYSDTRDFADKESQAYYFESKATHKYKNLSYQRVNNSIANPRVALTCRVPDLADNLYNCNYMMFQNNNFGTKWFYAFIKQVNYISPECTEIVYELDHIQTWLFDFDVKSAFVEREHSSTDEPFENILPEPVDITEYTSYQNYAPLDPDLFTIWYGILATSTPLGQQPTLSQIGNTFCGLELITTNNINSLVTNVQSYLDSAKNILTNNVANNIVSIYSCYGEPGGAVQEETKEISAKDNITPPQYYDYTIKNKKLLNSQFRYFLGVTNEGKSMVFKPEKIIGNKLTFNRIIIHSIVPIITYVPFYEGIEGNWNYPLTISTFIQCAWATDSFTSWFHDNAFSLFAGLSNSFTQTSIGALSGSLPLLASGATGLTNAATTLNEAVNAPDKAHGAIFDKNTALQNKRPELIIYEVLADKNSIIRADNFMTRFGYTTNKMKIPNRKSRFRYNYIKVTQPLITGSLPVESVSIIKNALIRGITFWHDKDVGNYEIENRVTGIEGW